MSKDTTVHVAVLMLDFQIHMTASLKQKRSVVRRFKEHIRSKFNVSIAEVGELDKWQRAVFGVSMIGNEKPFLDQCMQSILEHARKDDTMQLLGMELHFL